MRLLVPLVWSLVQNNMKKKEIGTSRSLAEENSENAEHQENPKKPQLSPIRIKHKSSFKYQLRPNNQIRCYSSVNSNSTRLKLGLDQGKVVTSCFRAVEHRHLCLGEFTRWIYNLFYLYEHFFFHSFACWVCYALEGSRTSSLYIWSRTKLAMMRYTIFARILLTCGFFI